MKGTQLPINAMIILIMGTLILVGVLTMFLGVWNPSAGGTGLEAAKTTACQQLISRGCVNTDLDSISISDYDADGDGDSTNDNLEVLCAYKYGCVDNEGQDMESNYFDNDDKNFLKCCKVDVCGCSVYK